MAKKRASVAARIMAILDSVSPDVQLEVLSQMKERYAKKGAPAPAPAKRRSSRGNGTPTLTSTPPASERPVAWLPEPTVV